MEKLTRSELRQLDNELRMITQADETITGIGERLEDKAVEYGEAMRLKIGRNLLTQFTNDRLGQIVGCAVINALLEVREKAADEIRERVEVPPAPCPVQFPDPSEQED